MATGKTPRRSKSTKDPVTIDLEAERGEAIERDEGTKPEDMTADEPEVAAPQGDPVDPPADMQEAAEPSQEHSKSTDEQETSWSAVTDPDAPAEAAAASDERKAETPSHTASHPPSQTIVTKGPATSTLVAAGIIGGIIALAGAGAIQYAGYMPALGPSQSAPQVNSDLESRIAALQGKVDELSNAAPAAADTSALEARISEIENEIQSAPAAADASQIESLQQQLQQSNEALAALKTEVADTKSSIGDTQTQIEQRLTEAEKKIDEPRTDVEMARAVAATALKSAVERGGPFLSELDTLAGIAPDDPAIEQLRPYASTGIESRAELVRRFPDTADAILTAIYQPGAEEGLGSRLLSSAMSVIKVRPVGNIEGDDPEAIVARMEDKLRNGDLKGAELEWQTLPEPGKAASSEFDKDLKDRIAVEAIVDKAFSNAVNGKG